MILHAVFVIGIMGYIFGGSYFSVYVPPPMSVSPIVLVKCIHVGFLNFSILLYFVCLFLGTHNC